MSPSRPASPPHPAPAPSARELETAQATACETGQVRTATFTADVAAPGGTTYGLVMNPEGNLDARDLAGNPFLPRSIYTFTV